MAYWGAAMTYNHPFWDPQPQADETAAWTLATRSAYAIAHIHTARLLG